MQARKNDPMLNVTLRAGGPRLLQWHHENGADISVEDYLARHQAIRSRGMEGSQRIYLDTNYWVRIREARLGLRDGVWSDLLDVLRARVRDRSAICLLNYWSFAEIARQRPDWLRATCELVDELCEGISLAAPQELEDQQAAEYLASRLGFDHDPTPNQWTCVARLHRTPLASMPEGMTQRDISAITKATWDVLFSASFFELMDALGWSTDSVFGARHIDEHTIDTLEALKAQRTERKLTRQDVRVEEFSGVMRGQYALRFTHHLVRLSAEQRRPLDVHQLTDAVRNLVARAVEDFRHDQLGKLLPKAALMSELSALYFANAQMGRLTDNDYVDWEHAATALPHSHVFLTERRLRGQLSDLRAGERYGCEVFSDQVAALDFLRKQ